MKKYISFAIVFAAAIVATGQVDLKTRIVGGERPKIAIPVFRGSGEAGKFMGEFNQTLNSEIETSGAFTLVSTSMMPRGNPQQPQDFKPAGTTGNGGGYWITDWAAPPVSANYLAFGYTGIQGDRLVLFGWLYDVRQPQANAQIIGKLYFGAISNEGAKQVAREFAADILKLMGAQSLAGSRIYFVSSRGGNKQIWVMDYDGSNQRPFAPYRELCTMPSVSPDGERIAFTRFVPGGMQIMMHATESGRRLPFLNPVGSFNATLSFHPDGQRVVFGSKIGGFAQLHVAKIDGSGLRRLSETRAVEVEPKINPKTGADLVFVSGRSGPQQIYRMNIDGADVSRLTTGEGQASNPSWHPDGRHVAFSWTRGYEPGNWNVFIMDVTSREYVQLTHGQGRNENPSWAPDGRHLVFASNRRGGLQIYTMLADGTNVRQLTSAGHNEMPVWGKK